MSCQARPLELTFRCSFLCIDIEEDHSNESVSATDMYLYLLGRQTTPQHARNQYLTIHLLRAQAKSTASYSKLHHESAAVIQNHLHIRLLQPFARESRIIKHRVYSARMVRSLRLAPPRTVRCCRA